jgi:genome maintenance exonuclease 1
MACYDLSLGSLSMPSFQRFEPKRISINKKRHYILEGFPNVPEGTVLPSVTTVLSSMAPVGKIMALINWRKKIGEELARKRTRLAADRGTWLHSVLEDALQGNDIECHLERKSDWAPYFQVVEPFLELIDKPLLAESAVAWWDESLQIGVSGTQDLLAQMADGSIALIDWKSSWKQKPDYQLADYKKQLGAYASCLEQMYGIEINNAYCVIACYDPEEENSEQSLQVLQMEDYELYSQSLIFRDTVKRYFEAFYPGKQAFSLTQDKG